MKTKALVLERCVPVFLASLLILFPFGCSETYNVDPIPQPEDVQLNSGNIITEQYTIGPEGGHITALGETVCLDFPEGAVTEPTLLNISTFPIHQLDHYDLKLMNRGVSIQSTGIDRKFSQMVRIRMKYDLTSQKGTPENEENLTIYSIYGNYYRFPNIYPVGECCVDCDCKAVIGCICASGTYVVGEN
jgi:hypothetical protein